MMTLDKYWKPGFGELITWFAMDKYGAIAVMVNNCFGALPSVLLGISDVDRDLDRFNEFMWEESTEFSRYPENKKGVAFLDLYSAYAYRHTASRQEVESWIAARSMFDGKLTEYSLPSIKGYYVFHGVEGTMPGEDFPVGYDGVSVTGDYFRYLMPSVFAGIEDIPVGLRSLIAVSDSLDFSKDAIICSDHIDYLFTHLFAE
ncbi:hypothetical protein BK666_28295 [Pseudomonas frederiksbergensis]|uniref:Uncharacterized protein n=1 Tax=Pseudomonas frederiksbergensis TaxID=104087 RepID=A0A423JN79_9PSED|nr:hypothetical protein [Pseudomonas frederiksbergensis]RON39148.1 hypothetical protein BK666_28295 [Pseudomonas frederiksbergensis]